MRPELAAFKELDVLVRNLGEQLAQFRRRALSAEVKCRELEEALVLAADEQVRLSGLLHAATSIEAEPEVATSAINAGGSGKSLEALEEENRKLRERLDKAREHTGRMVDRVRFLRQQLGSAQ